MKRLIRLSMAAFALTVILLLVSSMQSQSLKASSNENIKIEKSMRQERKKASDDANMQKSDKDLATRVIETGTEGKKLINYTELIPVLINAVQQLSSEVEELKGKISK